MKWLGSLVIGLGLAGCESSSEVGPLVPVSGIVRYNGVPLDGAEVTLHPASPGHPGWLPVGQTDDSGRFEVGTRLPGDGAPPGRYAVTIVWRPDASDNDDAPNLLPEAFASPDRSGLELDTNALLDPNTPLSFDLTGRPLPSGASPR